MEFTASVRQLKHATGDRWNLKPLILIWMYKAILKSILTYAAKGYTKNGRGGAGENEGAGAKKSNWGGKIDNNRCNNFWATDPYGTAYLCKLQKYCTG